MFEIGLFVLGSVAGILSGLFGVGGGIVMVPVLVAFFGMEMLDANATSLAAMLLPVGIMGVMAYYKAGMIRVRESLWISLGLFLGSFFGAELAITVDAGMLSKLYAAFLLYVALGYIFGGKKGGDESSFSNKDQGRSAWIFVVTGIGAGIIAGLFGKGGGLVIVPVLIKFFKYSPKAAAATSLAALLLPVGLPSVMVYATEGHLNILNAAIVAAGIVLGTFFGTKFALKLPSETFKRCYAIFLMGVACYMVYKYM